MTDWLDIESAPRDGTLIEAQNRRSSFSTRIYKTFWGAGEPHTIEGYPTLNGYEPTETGYVVNEGRPWWMNEDGVKMAPTPTHWRHLEEAD